MVKNNPHPNVKCDVCNTPMIKSEVLKEKPLRVVMKCANKCEDQPHIIYEWIGFVWDFKYKL